MKYVNLTSNITESNHAVTPMFYTHEFEGEVEYPEDIQTFLVY